MAKYIGTMMEQEYGKNIYHNFYPIAKLWEDNSIHLLTPKDQQDIFPESKWNNVGFKEASSFLEKDLCICTVDFETEAEEATTTYYSYTLINESNVIDSIQSAYTYGIYRGIEQPDFSTIARQQQKVYLSYNGAIIGEEILILLKGFFAGPFLVQQDEGGCYIEPQLEHNKLILGYAQRDVEPYAYNLPMRKNHTEEQLSGVFCRVDSKAKQDTINLILQTEIGRQQEELESLQEEIRQHQQQLELLTLQEGAIKEDLQQCNRKMVELTLDRAFSSKMVQAAAEWENQQNQQHLQQKMQQWQQQDCPDMPPEQLVEYLCSTIQKQRPTYNKNTILNIAICFTQNLLTVFSGKPGCGKTSICNLFGKVLGLDALDRYIPVSVERGWTSKRDFIGYFNPLTKKFDQSNQQVYEILSLLDREKQEDCLRFPALILLDEANLSPMEYYWADFMNICDDLGEQSKINLGAEYLFTIPKTLHFAATINNDHTTETLSPRLVDRTWIITLPQQDNLRLGDIQPIQPEELQPVSWDSLEQAFIAQKEDFDQLQQWESSYSAIVEVLKEADFSISPRVELSIRRYCAVAIKYFEGETLADREKTALDYAVSQRLLPKIQGSGAAFGQWLEGFKEICQQQDLPLSVQLLDDIIKRGNKNMKYYQFFC